VTATPDIQRPTTFIGFASDICSDPRKAVTFVLVTGSLLVIITICIVGICVAIAEASKGMRGVPLRYLLPAGVGGASMVTFVTVKVRRFLGKLRKARQSNATSVSPKDST
jgi:hypothetical protein